MFKLALVAGNILEEKLAGYRGFETYQNLDFRLTQFFPSMILNIPGFLIAENPKTIALTNAFLSVIAPLIALRVFLNETKLQLSPRLILFYFVPSVFLWGCFGLREYVVILFIVLALYFYTKKNFILCLIALFFVLISRPEYLVFAPLLIFFGINSSLNSIGKTLFFIVTILAVPLIVVMAVQYALSNFTLAEVSGFDLKLLENIVDSRFYRQFRSDGGDTAFYTPAVYEEMKLLEKLIFNVINTYFLFDFSNYRNALVLLLDTAALILFTMSFWARGLIISTSRLKLISILIVVLIILSLLVVNGGNAFRVRFIPLFFLGILYIVPKKQRLHNL